MINPWPQELIDLQWRARQFMWAKGKTGCVYHASAGRTTTPAAVAMLNLVVACAYYQREMNRRREIA